MKSSRLLVTILKTSQSVQSFSKLHCFKVHKTMPKELEACMPQGEICSIDTHETEDNEKFVFPSEKLMIIEFAVQSGWVAQK